MSTVRLISTKSFTKKELLQSTSVHKYKKSDFLGSGRSGVLSDRRSFITIHPSFRKISNNGVKNFPLFKS